MKPRAAAFRGLTLFAVVAVAAGQGPRAVAAGEDREPKPPYVFFPEPDPETRRQIQDVIDTHFGDTTKAVVGREILVERFGLWSAPVLVAIVERGENETKTWNSILALGTLRCRKGPSPNLWPAVSALARTLEAKEPYRRMFSALVLGCSYGPEAVRRVAPPRPNAPDAYEEARKAHAAAVSGLAKALSDPDPSVRAAAALALGKTGGAVAADQVAAWAAKGGEAAVPPRVAGLLAQGLLPASDGGRIREALRDGEAKVRAAAALAAAAWAVTQRYGEGAETAATALSRALALDADLVPTQNTVLRSNGPDGAEAAFARGALALATGRPEAWDDLFTLATMPSTEAETAIAAAQALLFAPTGSNVRTQMAGLAGRHTLQQQPLKDGVLAAFLVVAGEDGSPIGVRACSTYLKEKAREPRGKPDWDVRHYAAIGLARALESGTITDPAAREEAIHALADAPKKGISGNPGDAYRFKDVLEQVMSRGTRDNLLANPTAALRAGSSSQLEAAAKDPDALLARDPVGVAVDRLNDMTWRIFGLDALPKAVVGGAGGGPREVSHADQQWLFLKGWLEKDPYFSDRDLHRDRGRMPVPTPSSPPDVNR